MKTKSTGQMSLLKDGEYRGFWVGNTVTVPFPLEEILFEVLDFKAEVVEVSVAVQGSVAYIETLGD